MWNQTVLDRLETKRTAARTGGGERRIEKQHAKGKLTARERLEFLFDEDTFQEINAFRETRITDFGLGERVVPGDGVVTGIGKINGRCVCASSQDFTVCGGAGGEAYALKMCEILQKAIDIRVPYVNLNDSGGARIEEGICSLSAYSKLFRLNTIASGYIPQISAIMGPCAGGAAYSPALSDFIFMVEGTSQMYLTGPAVVRTVTGEVIDADALGGASVHMSKSGVAHFAYPDETSCLDAVKQLLGYLPSSCDEKPPVHSDAISVDLCKGLQELVSDDQRKCYDAHAVIGAMADKRSFLEVQKDFARNVVVGLGTMDGETVGFIANQPQQLAGSLDIDAADKIARFVRTCDCFNIPLVTFVDVPAFLPGSNQEYRGVIRHGAKVLYAFAEASVPKISVVLRKAYGGAYCAMNSKDLGADIVYAWPIAQIAVMGADGAVNILFKKQIEQAEDSKKAFEEFKKEYAERFMNPYYAASRGFVDEVILPEDTRKKVAVALQVLKTKKARIGKRHGNIPL